MNNSEELLQRYLQKLDDGHSLTQLREEMPEEDRTLEPLLAVANMLREAPDPPVEVSRAQAHHQKVMAAIEAAASNSSSGSATPWWSQMQQRLAVLRSSARRLELPRLALLRLEMPPLPRLQATGGLIAVVLIILAIWFTSL